MLRFGTLSLTNRWHSRLSHGTKAPCSIGSDQAKIAIESRFMSQHRSLRGASVAGAKRNVLKRFERVDLLKKRGQWKAGDRVSGLRKTKPDV
jgi:small basic protein (TIGR04137 family)